MGAVSVEGVGLAASCPGTIAIGELTRLEGQASYTLVNRTSDDGLVNVVLELADSAGHHMQESQVNMKVAAGESSFNETPFLNASYDAPGLINVTIRLTVTGDGKLTDFTDCNFNVE